MSTSSAASLLGALIATATLGSTAHASHPHQRICLVTVDVPNDLPIQFLLQTESGREYAEGNPDKDTYDYRYQIRDCADDNVVSSCTTYQSSTITHDPTEEVTMVGMKDKHDVFFRGHFTDDAMKGEILGDVVKDGKVASGMVPFKAALTSCLSASWVKLDPERNRPR